MVGKILESRNFILRFVINFGDCDGDIDDDKYMRPKADDSHPSLLLGRADGTLWSTETPEREEEGID